MTTVTCKIPESLNVKLEILAKQYRISKSQIVREALERRLKQSKNKKPLRAIDLVRHLSGRVHGCPADLATNPVHMEGFGE